jgi:hypothetical protein
MSDEIVIQSNSGFTKPKGDYGEHLTHAREEYKRVMCLGFPSGNARDAYACRHIAREANRSHIPCVPFLPK